MNLSLRLASRDDLVLLRQMYRELLRVLVQSNLTVDPSRELEDDWIRKPGQLFPWLIERSPEDAQNKQTLGFALVCGQAYSKAMGSPAEFVLYEFLVTQSERRTGIGRTALDLLFAQHAGSWSLDVLPGNKAAMAFWTAVLARYAPECVDHVAENGVIFARHRFRTEIPAN